MRAHHLSQIPEDALSAVLVAVEKGGALTAEGAARGSRRGAQVFGSVTPVWPWYLPPRSR